MRHSHNGWTAGVGAIVIAIRLQPQDVQSIVHVVWNRVAPYCRCQRRFAAAVQNSFYLPLWRRQRPGSRIIWNASRVNHFWFHHSPMITARYIKLPAAIMVFDMVDSPKAKAIVPPETSMKTPRNLISRWWLGIRAQLLNSLLVIKHHDKFKPLHSIASFLRASFLHWGELALETRGICAGFYNPSLSFKKSTQQRCTAARNFWFPVTQSFETEQ